ncbi:HET-domain-containing protein [Lizonia empirigonia]|nr:HET-domain-containing protein [Lizonia empirigonia]
MMQQPVTFTTTYNYKPLEYRHVRLLECTRRDTSNDTLSFEYRIIYVEISEDGQAPEFEAVSYTWGDAAKVTALPLGEGAGHIALTANLSQALPYLSHHSATKRLWIDQLCINQSDDAEKGVQVGLMSEIYSKARRVILCKEWLAGLNQLLSRQTNAGRTLRESMNYHGAHRYGTIKDINALTDFWLRPYFTRGWVVQEFLLGHELAILAGNTCFAIYEVEDIYHAAQTLGSNCQSFPMAAADTLFSMTGMLEGLDFRPDYQQPIVEDFARCMAMVARDFGSLDFLGLNSSIIDRIAESRPDKLQLFPSWVPSWSSRPFTSPFRMVCGGTDSVMTDISWNASAGRKHTQPQPSDPGRTLKLHVRGRIIDFIHTISPTVIGTADFDVDPSHLQTVVSQLKKDLPSCCETWTPLDFVHYSNMLKCNGNKIQPFESAAAVLNPEPRDTTAQLNKTLTSLSNKMLGLIIGMGRGRRFAMMEKKRLGLVPLFGSQAASETQNGSPIAILHGCIVPLVLDCVDEIRKEYRVVGEAFTEGVMHGEAATWDESEADEFILV